MELIHTSMVLALNVNILNHIYMNNLIPFILSLSFTAFSTLAMMYQKNMSMHVLFLILAVSSGVGIAGLVFWKTHKRDQHFAAEPAQQGERYRETLKCSDPLKIRNWAREQGFKEHPLSSEKKLLFHKGGLLLIPTYFSYDTEKYDLEIWIQANGVAQSITSGNPISVPHKKAIKSLNDLRLKISS